MDLALLVGNVATVCTVASNFAGLFVCIDISKQKSTAGVSSLPFLSAAVCASFWLQYGIVIRDNVLAIVNFIAVFMQLCYLTFFYYSTVIKTTLNKWLMSSALFVLSVHLYAFYMATEQMAIQTLGILACLGSIASSAAPLSSIRMVFRNQSTESLPFLIILSYFVVTCLWCVYGILIADAFIKVPNAIGAMITGFQLSLFVIYDSKRHRKTSAQEKHNIY